ncbi:MAG: TonB-dependent receptor, partial [Paramuribaculum sp.]|nr:TonB-dependent receptor [Paramuribaculum sp.]
VLNRSVRHTATVNANYAHTWESYTLNVNLTGRVQSKTYYPGDADGDAPGYGIWNLTTRHTFDSFRSFTLTPGIGIDNILNRRDNRPLNKNFALYSPGRSVVVSLTVKLK